MIDLKSDILFTLNRCLFWCSYLTCSCHKSACCLWTGWKAGSWTHCRSWGVGTGFPGSAALRKHWRPRGASCSGYRALSALRTQHEIYCQSHSAFIHRNRWLGVIVPPSLFKHPRPALHNTLPPKPAQTHKLSPLFSSLSHTHTIPNPVPQGRALPSIPNQVRRTCHQWLQTQRSEQWLPQALSLFCQTSKWNIYYVQIFQFSFYMLVQHIQHLNNT